MSDESGHADVHRYVLFLDDEAGIVDTFVIAAQVAGIEALGFTQPGQALDRFRRDPGSFRAVITDFTMPQMPCAEFVNRIKEIRADIPIHLCTGNAEHEIQEATARLGIRSVLYKPFDYETLEAFLAGIPRGTG